MVEYRLAYHTDIENVIDCGARFIKEHHSFRDLDYDRGEVGEYIAYHIDDPDNELFLALHGGEVIGLLFVGIHPSFFGRAKLAMEQTLYVAPAFRSTRVAFTLMRLFEAWAEEKGADRIFVSVTSGINTDSTQKFLERMGYDCGGPNMIKRL